jgi:hypothetical protein
LTLRRLHVEQDLRAESLNDLDRDVEGQVAGIT